MSAIISGVLCGLSCIQITLEVLMGLNSLDSQGLQENPLDVRVIILVG